MSNSRVVIYKAGQEYIGRIRDCHVFFHPVIAGANTGHFRVVKYIPGEFIRCDVTSYARLDSLLRLKDIPETEIREFMKRNRFRLSDSVRY